MKVVELVQGSPEWIAHRFEHNNASEAPFIMGKSKKVSRDEVLRMKATKEEKEYSDFIKNVVFEKGHEAEAAARPIIEKQFDIKFSALVAVNGKLGSSFDGLDFDNVIGWEHKIYNKELFALMEAGEWPQDHIWQMEHHFLVCPTLKEIIFTVSDGTEENCISQVYKSTPARRKKLIAAWELFDKDLAEYIVPEKVEKLEPEVPKQLPSIQHEVKGTLINTNFSKYREQVMILVEQASKPMESDQDFVNGGELAKTFIDAEDKIEQAKAAVLAKFSQLEEFTNEADEIKEMIRQPRIRLVKLVEAEKVRRKALAMSEGEKAVLTYLEGVNSGLEGVSLDKPLMLFQAATKGMSSLEKIIEKVNQTVADLKLGIDEEAGKVRINLKALEEQASGFKTLFPDLQQLVFKDPEDFQAFITARIATHKAEQAEKERLEKEAEDKRLADLAAQKIIDDEALLQKPAEVKLEKVEAKDVGDHNGFFETPVQQTSTPVESEQKTNNFSNEQYDLDQIEYISNYLESLEFPEMKTLRGQQIIQKARNTMASISAKLIEAGKTI